MTRGCHRLLLFVQQAPPSVSELGEALSRALVLGKLALPELEHVLNGWRKAVYFCALRCPRRVGWQYEGGGEGRAVSGAGAGSSGGLMMMTDRRAAVAMAATKCQQPTFHFY